LQHLIKEIVESLSFLFFFFLLATVSICLLASQRLPCDLSWGEWLIAPPPRYGATVFFSMSPFVSLIWTSRFLYLMILSFEPIIILKNYVWLLFNDWMLNSASLFQLMLWFLLFFVCCFYCLSIMDPLIAISKYGRVFSAFSLMILHLKDTMSFSIFLSCLGKINIILC
jgi:hypothetical protein